MIAGQLVTGGKIDFRPESGCRFCVTADGVQIYFRFVGKVPKISMHFLDSRKAFPFD